MSSKKCTSLRISSKLIALVLVLGICIAGFAWYGIYQAKRIDAEYHRIYTEDMAPTAMASAAGMHFNQSRAVLLRAMLQQDPLEQQQSLERMRELDGQVDVAIQRVMEQAKSAEGKSSMQQLKNQIAHYRQLRTSALQLTPDGKLNEAAFDQAQQEGKSVSSNIEAIYTMASTAGEKEMAAVGDKIAQNILMMVVVVLIVNILAVLVGILFARQLSRRFEKLDWGVGAVASGDLSQEIHASNDDELGRIGRHFDHMRQNMHNAIAEIHMAAEQVAAGAKNVSDASVSLSQGAAEQASSVEELSSSIAEIASQTRSNADNADKANALTAETKGHAEVGNTDMAEMLRAMEDINASSANISKIIKVIDEIAFQTNILALNAAVEAARAGQHGKGFAVVAEEVRNLAARSAKAAKETTDMIEGSITKVNDGRNIAHKTAEAVETSVTNVAEVADLVGSIAKASKEQNLAIEQINQGVLQVSQVVQANSATSEESASASEQLSAQADVLKQTAGKFKLDASVITKTAGQPPKHTETPAAPKAAARPPKPARIALTEEEGFGKY